MLLELAAHANGDCTAPPVGIVGAAMAELISRAWIWSCLVTILAVYRNTRVYDPRVLARCP